MKKRKGLLKKAIAGVMAMEPKCIVFDEPTAMLDPQGRKEVYSFPIPCFLSSIRLNLI